MKHFSSFSAVVLIIFFLSGCGLAPVATVDPSKPLEVVASFYPLAHFSEQVGKDRVHVSTVVPNGTEPHDYEPTAADITKIRNAQAFFFIGGGFEPWAEKIEGGTAMSVYLNLQKMQGEDAPKGANRAGGEEDGGGFDPHIWLDPLLAKRQVEIIRDAFLEKDPSNRKTYQANAAQYLRKLDQLDTEFRRELKACRANYSIVSHDAFGYLTRRYGLNLTAISGLSPHEEPSAKRLAELTELAREKKVRYIFFETLASPKLAQVIAKEVGAQTLVLNPIEGLSESEIAEGKNYLSLMRENLNNLKIALGCQ